MEEMWRLRYMFEPSSLLLVVTAVGAVLASAHRALRHERETQRASKDASGVVQELTTSITLDAPHALILPLTSSVSLLVMFYLFASISQLVTLLTTALAVGSLAFTISPYLWKLSTCLGAPWFHPWLVALTTGTSVILWLLSGHWLLNNLLAISICITFVTLVRLPNVKVCTLLLCMLFFYDIFWVFWSERFFGTNVMVSVATQQASNPMHTVADKLNLPGLDSIARKLDMPGKIIYPRDLVRGMVPTGLQYMMLGLGDMALPGLLLALVLCFDYCKDRLSVDVEPRKHKYIWFAVAGYTLGLFASLAAGLLTSSPQPALLYLVPSTLGTVMFAAWRKGEFVELWNGPRPVINDKSQLDSV